MFSILVPSRLGKHILFMPPQLPPPHQTSWCNDSTMYCCRVCYCSSPSIPVNIADIINTSGPGLQFIYISPDWRTFRKLKKIYLNFYSDGLIVYKKSILHRERGLEVTTAIKQPPPYTVIIFFFTGNFIFFQLIIFCKQIYSHICGKLLIFTKDFLFFQQRIYCTVYYNAVIPSGSWIFSSLLSLAKFDLFFVKNVEYSKTFVLYQNICNHKCSFKWHKVHTN